MYKPAGERGKQPLRRRDPLLMRNLITHAVIPLGSHVRSWQEYEWAWPMGDLCLKGAKHNCVKLCCAGYRQLCTMTYVHNSSNSSFNLWKLGEIWGAIDDFHGLIVSSQPSEVQKKKKLRRASWRVSLTTKTIYFYEMQRHKRGSGDCVMMPEPLLLVFRKCRQRT